MTRDRIPARLYSRVRFKPPRGKFLFDVASRISNGCSRCFSLERLGCSFSFGLSIARAVGLYRAT